MLTQIVYAMDLRKLFSMMLTSLFIISAIFSVDSFAAKNHSHVTVQSDKILIVYLSRTKNTKTLATMIHDAVGGKIIAIELVTPYPADYQTMVDQVRNENQREVLPPLKTHIENIEQYDVIFIGYPTWGMRLPPPIKSFLVQYNLQEKTVIPFNTNAGYGLGNSIETLTNLCHRCTILPSFSVIGGKERDGQLLMIKNQRRQTVNNQLQQWLNQLGFNITN